MEARTPKSLKSPRDVLRPRDVPPADVARVVIIAATLLMLSSCYLLNQGASLLRYQAAAEPIDEILERGTFSDGSRVDNQTRAFIAEVEQIREYSAALGLAASRNYTSLVPTNRDYLADVVNAAAELAFERHEWWWPFVGRLPYKGYYDTANATRLAQRLDRRGLDVWVRRVDAFSTLGVFRDPLYEFMTDYDRHMIANLIIHEQAHATLFLQGHAQFNEEFATFVGDVGADGYMIASGASDEEVGLVTARAADRETARLLILGLRTELDELYGSELGTEEKRSAKAAAISAFQDRIRDEYESIFRADSFRGLSEIPINNAFIDLYVSYTEDLDLFRELYEALSSDLSVFIDTLGVLEDPGSIPDRDLRRLARRDPKAYIRTWLLDSSGQASVE
ncbi:MAG: aminopeptidase [Spirochaetales bacterium]|nr:aminopeptidase [Spirochaetales bacterium]